ncbi:elongation factor 1-beta-like protein [Dinothrombium tinctorium]|uniref:Elongation factor 1-beta-like protein n=1 Tax=Dinothrombium tinctorium TaxID=1965070 RepID=A0A3S3QC84_9ACAR|nr:elongation factor 1-beta-like protein [Dinothrombium tinctorium]RWS13615.1 elongation factor 1-beta-like protein [Dinothrombium tinctorium]
MTLNVGGDINSASGLSKLNEYLSSRSYIEGYSPSQADVTLFDAVDGQKLDAAKYPHVKRWLNHIASYSSEERKQFTGVKKDLTAYGVTANGATSGGDKEEDDDIDLFGDDDDEEADKAREERLKAYHEKKSKKPALIAKSSVVLDVKPWDDETDMSKLEECVRSVQMDGLLWGASKLVPLAYGIKKLQIVCVVEDDKVGIDDLSEKIQEFEDYVQSVDVAAFQKI